jgi:hypothetical protein
MTFSDRFVTSTLLVFALLAPSAAHAEPSPADLASARQLYNDALELRDRGDLKGALEKFKAAHALGNTPLTGLDLCKTHASLRQPVDAREACLSVARIAQTANETGRSRQARLDAARIAEEERGKIALVRIRLSGVPQGREPNVVVDGVPIPTVALAEARALNPGTHELTARVETGPEARASFEVREGETKEITLIVQAPPPGQAAQGPAAVPPPYAGNQPPGAAPPPKKKSGLTAAGFAIAGIGAGLGIVTGLVAINGKSELDDRCLNKICGRADHDDLDAARRWADVSTASFIVGGVGLAMGFFGLLSDAKSSGNRAAVVPAVGPGSMGMRGAF